MSTTAVFIELIISGIQSLIWCFMLLISVFGHKWLFAILPDLKDWSTIVMVILFAIAYTFGVIIDQIALVISLVIKPKDILLKLKSASRKSKQFTERDIRAIILSKEGKSSNFLNYIRSRIRIVRSTLINIFMITIASLILLFSRSTDFGIIIKWYYPLVIILIGLILIIISLFILGTLQYGYDSYTEALFKELNEDERKHLNL
ncbi:MAG: hypothetical protein PVH61_06800 [Candidatus Aminicenantes bacterium]|jgi:hypothetical protein